MKEYLTLMKKILDEGVSKEDRTGTGTTSLFGYQMRFNLNEGFPLLTTKKVHLKSIIYELLWFLRGDSNIKYLKEHGVSIWDEWADADGNLGPVYGAQWRHWRCEDGTEIDQIANLMIAKVCGFELGDFVHTFGDVHIYNNHREQVALQLTREPRELPKMIIHGNQRDIFDFKYEDFELVGYNPYPAIKAPVAV